MKWTGIGNSMVGLAMAVIIQQRFNANRALATGIAALGITLGNTLGAPITNWLLRSYGLRGTLLLTGAILLHRLPLALTFRTPAKFIKKKVHFDTKSLNDIWKTNLKIRNVAWMFYLVAYVTGMMCLTMSYASPRAKILSRNNILSFPTLTVRLDGGTWSHL